ncbi:MAG TPA: lysylphosphatidylglycerol synthase transmembrane domain-containing protein [Candidatus Limnocylindrales bacterium]|nr:lysylphosphatidylglycerol synthase transmembrane domain-containing protein [Candidatus Limnocylindrales bacterium]
MSGLPGATGPRGGAGSDAERRSGDERRTGEERRDASPPIETASPPIETASTVPATPPTEDDRRSGAERRSDLDRRTNETVTADQLSLGRRLRQRRTIVSLVLPLLLLVLFARALPGFKLDQVPGLILQANPLLLFGAFAVFYSGFPLRGLRWAILIRATGFPLRVRDATEIIFISWLVNCLVPAKLGDLYRAYLLKINSTVSLSRTFGTVFIERILDLFAIVTLGLASGYWSFRGRLPGDVQLVFAVGVGVVVLLAGGLLTMRNFGRRLMTALPLPHRVTEFYDRFEEGVFSAVGLRALPRLIVLTALVWATEAMRLFLVVEALGFKDVHLGISGAFFVALTGSLLTAVPLTPAGIGVVEAGVVFVLTVVYNIDQPQALAIVLVDRVISVLSIIGFGSLAYWFSPKRRGMGVDQHRPVEVSSA